MYRLTLRMDKLVGVDIEEKEFMGRMVKFITFPMDINGLYFLNERLKIVRWSFNMYEKAPNEYNQSHYISPIIQGENKKSLDDNGWSESLRFFGTATNKGSRKSYSGSKKVFYTNKTHVFDGMDKTE